MTIDDPFTSEQRLCDDDGWVTGNYLGLHNHLRRLSFVGQGRLAEYKPTPEPFFCTGNAHLAGEHFRCTSPAHAEAEEKDPPGLWVGGEASP